MGTPDVAFVPDCAGIGSSRGTISIKKSNWSDLLSALAMSARERVRRLLESAMINARAVISEMNTKFDTDVSYTVGGYCMCEDSLSQALQNKIGAIFRETWSMSEPDRPRNAYHLQLSSINYPDKFAE